MTAAAEVCLVFCENLCVDCEISVVRNLGQSIDRRTASELAVQAVVSFILVHQSEISLDRQPFKRRDVDSELAGNHVRISLLSVHLIVPDGVADDVRTYEISLVGIIYLHSVLIHDIALRVSDIKRIDRAHVICDVEYVA